MKFLRHLAAVTLIVAVVVIIGLAWNHFGASTLAGGLQGPVRQVGGPGRLGGRPPPGALALLRGSRPGPHGVKVIRVGPMNLGLSSMLDPVNLADLKHTVIIEALVIAVVVMIDVSRRLWRQEKRARQLALERLRDDETEPGS